MAKNIDPKLKKIGEYLKLDESSSFVIPEYQRAYSWETKHCDKLWQDIEAFIESGGNDPYFFGTIIINCQYNDTKLSLIDGQQRTTTFLLLLKAMLLRLNYAIDETANDKDSERLHAVLTIKRNTILKILYRAKDDDIFDILEDFSKVKDVKVLENLSNNELHKKDLIGILKAPDFLGAEISVTKIRYKQKNNKYTNYFRNFKFFYERLITLSSTKIKTFAENFLEKCEIIEIRSWNVDQAITMFNSLNSDGMPLLDADIISAQLYSNAANDRKAFNEKWETLLVKVNKLEQLKIADIDVILMQYMYINRARKAEYITDKGSIDVITPGLRRYYTEINKQLLKEPLGLCEELLRLVDMWLKIKDYPLVKLALKFNENIKLYIASFLSRYKVDDIIENAVRQICRNLLKLFAVLELVDTGYSSSKFKTFLFGENIKLVDENVDVFEVERDIDEHISKNWDMEEIRKSASEYEKNILVYLNEYLFAKNKGLEFMLTEKYDIEHIMPSSGKNIAQIQMDAGMENAEEFMSFVSKLGNKILLEEDINRSIGNEWFRTKIQTSITNKSGYKDSKYAIASNLVETYRLDSKPYWTKEDINKTTETIANRISDFVFQKESSTN